MLKKVLILFILPFFIAGSFYSNALAAPTEEELTAVLSELNWTKEDLEAYLDYYELTLTDFETIEDLKVMLGTPITPENLSKLLDDYDLTREELDILLAGFGETVQDYHFIEDLDVAVDFYMNHDNVMKEVEDFLVTIGINEEEADRLFNHFMSLDESKLEEQMETIGARLDEFMMLDPEAELTPAQQEELAKLWEEMMGIFELKAVFYLVDEAGQKTPVSFVELSMMKEFTSAALLIELYDLNNNLLLDMQLSQEMLSSDFAINAGEKITEIGDMAGELTTIKHDRLPNTASPYVQNMLIGIAIILMGITLFFMRRKKQT